ncbi:MAG: heparinase II/III domain-containing protein [Bacillota bacterium]
MLKSKSEFKPFPRASQRKPWNKLPDKLSREIIADGEQYLDHEWSFLPVSGYLEFMKTGNRSKYEAKTFKRRNVLSILTYAECVEHKGRFLEDIINGVWAICEESTWCIPAHNTFPGEDSATIPDITKPIVDIMASDTADLLSFIYYLFKDQLDAVSPLIRERIELEMKRRILDPYLEHDDFWWMGIEDKKVRLNNWTPWATSNILSAFFLMEEDDDRRKKAAVKAMKSLDQYLTFYHSDGGCDEGPSYWGGSGGCLFTALELLYEVSEGRINVYDEPLIQEIGRYIYRVYINDNYFVNFADCDATVQIDPYLVFRYGQRIDDSDLKSLAFDAWERLDKKGINKVSFGWRRPINVLGALFCYNQIAQFSQKKEGFSKESWMDGIEVLTARETKETDQGLYLAVKGGHNQESHNHNDVGQFIVYRDGKPFIIDVGVETYTAQTFSDQRYEIWTMQSAYHNLPRVNGVMQKNGKEYQASEVKYKSQGKQTKLSLDIAGAYPETAGLNSWQRTFQLNRGDKARIKIEDRYNLKEPSSDIKLSLMVAHRPLLEKPGQIVLEGTDGKKLELVYNQKKVSYASEEIKLEDKRLQRIWGASIYRIILSARKSKAQDVWEIKISKK